MSRNLSVLLVICSVIMAHSVLYARQQATAKTDSKGAPVRKRALPLVYLGNSNQRGGAIKRDEFNRLLKQGLTARDSAGNKYRVIGFEFSYGEKSLYEDSLGNNLILTDYLTEFCPGDTVSATVAASIYDRTKPGDSVYFDGIKLLKYINTTETVPATDATLGTGMKFGITK